MGESKMVTEKMIENAARAICRAAGDDWDWSVFYIVDANDTPESAQNLYIGMARAALELYLSNVKALEADRRMIVSHATMGRIDGEGQSVNDVCVTITNLRNELYAEAQKTAPSAEVQDAYVPYGREK
jgi:hypothetical protein